MRASFNIRNSTVAKRAFGGFSYFDSVLKLTTAPARKRGRRAPLGDRMRPAQNEVGRMLGLCGRVNQKFSIVAKFLEPSGNVRGLIRDDCVRDSGFGAKVGCSHLGYEFFFGIDGGPESGGFP